MKKIQILSLLAAFTLLVPYAYGIDNVPSSETAGAEQERFQEDAEREKALQNIQKKVETQDEAPAEVEEVESAADQGVTFALRSVEFSGNEKISSEKLKTQVQDSIGKTIGMRDLQKLASKVKNYYRAKGYVAAYVYLPPQDVTGGNSYLLGSLIAACVHVAASSVQLAFVSARSASQRSDA